VAETIPDTTNNGFGPNDLGRLVFLHSTNGGHTWAVQDNQSFAKDTLGSDIVIDQIDSSNIVASGNFGSGPRFSSLFRTSDGGATWHQQPGPTPRGIGDISFSSPNDGILIGGEIFLTSDGCEHWNTVPFYRNNTSRCHAYGNGMYRIFQWNTGKIFTTTNNWGTVDSTPPIFSDPVQMVDHVFYDCSFGAGDTMLVCGEHENLARDSGYPYLARTTDGGHHWSTVYDDTTGTEGYIIDPTSDVNRDTIVAGVVGYQNAVLWSSDNGITWEIDSLRFNDERYPYENQADGVGLNSDGDIVGAFDYWTNSVYTSFLSIGVPVTSGVNSNPFNSLERQLFPNPATTSVTIPGAETGSTVHLLDILGRDVLSDKVPPGGTLTLDVSRLPRGVYEAIIEKDGQMLPAGRVVLN